MQLTPDQRTLVERHIGIAEWAVVATRRKFGGMPADERLSLANLALVKLAQRYNPQRQATFKTFAHHTIAWQMVDLYRTEIHWRQKRRLELTSLQARYERKSQHRVHQALIDDDPLLATEDLALIHVDERLDAAAKLAAIPMTERERALLTAVADGDSLRVAGERLGVSESRACQIRSAVRRRSA